MAKRKRRIQETTESSSKTEDIIEIDDDEGFVPVGVQKKPKVSLPETSPDTNVKVKSSKTAHGIKIKSETKSQANDNEDGIDIKIPMSLLMTGTSAGSNECTVLVQVSPEDAPILDFHGAGGAVGRFEVDVDTGRIELKIFAHSHIEIFSQDFLFFCKNHCKVTMDLKGYQYQGGLQGGPTCIIAAMHPMIGDNMMKVESITDEFVTLQKTGDQLAQLDAVVEKGEIDDSFKVKDTNVNARDYNKDSGSQKVKTDDENRSVRKGKASKRKK